ncbi:hypothetical protein AA13595_2601 [Gluconacetobacter johannae DSM 13595]|nr:hypothetical protein AA13595_2601 [Gluconacetobacter johannae DSM 13595]
MPDKHPCKAIREAALGCYPALMGLHSILPENVRQALPDAAYVPWATGQYLAGVEASIVRYAIEAVMHQGGIALQLS